MLSCSCTTSYQCSIALLKQWNIYGHHVKSQVTFSMIDLSNMPNYDQCRHTFFSIWVNYQDVNRINAVHLDCVLAVRIMIPVYAGRHWPCYKLFVVIIPQRLNASYLTIGSNFTSLFGQEAMSGWLVKGDHCGQCYWEGLELCECFTCG